MAEFEDEGVADVEPDSLEVEAARAALSDAPELDDDSDLAEAAGGVVLFLA